MKIMKILNIVIIGICLTTIAAAQDITKSSTPPDIEILKKSWRKEKLNTGLNKDPFTGNNQYQNDARAQADANKYNAQKSDGLPLQQPVSPIRPQGELMLYVFQARIKNTGTRTIQAITWKYAFLNPQTNEEIRRIQSISKIKIAPAKSNDLIIKATAPSDLLPASKANQGQSQYIEQVVISRIEYNDGSVWESPQK
jgi:hypothetical protein